MNKTTYFLGAGASYNSIPVVNQLNDAMKDLIQDIESLITAEIISAPETIDRIKRFLDELKWLSGESKYFTIDTYAKKLFLLNESEKLHHLKRALSYFFTIIQKRESDIAGSSTKPHHKQVTLDPRYISLLASILTNDPSGEDKVILPDDINFISWNYDFQLEMAMSQFNGLNSIRDLHDLTKFKIFPFTGLTEDNHILENFDPKLVHLNGVAGLYEVNSRGENFTYNLFDRDNNESLSKFIRETDFFYDDNSLDRKSANSHNTFSFAWEKSYISELAGKYAARIMSQTEILVVIGYSFPFFNRDVDRKLINEFLQNGKKIYFQDPNLDGQFLYDQFDIDRNSIQIVHRKDVNQFFLPFEL